MTDETRPALSRRSAEVAFAVVTMAVGAVVMFGAWEHDIGWGDGGPEAGYFPFRLGALIVLASAFNLIAGLRHHVGAPSFIGRDQTVRVVTFFLPVAGLAWLTPMLGLYVASALYLVVTVCWLAGVEWRRGVAIAAGVPLLMFALFELALRTPLPKGPLERAFGIY